MFADPVSPSPRSLDADPQSGGSTGVGGCVLAGVEEGPSKVDIGEGEDTELGGEARLLVRECLKYRFSTSLRV